MDTFVLEVLVTFLDSLALAHDDDQGVGELVLRDSDAKVNHFPRDRIFRPC